MNNYIAPELHPDLRPYLQGDELHHPFLQLEGGVYPALYHRINQCYKYKIRQIDTPKQPNEWEAYLPHLAPSDRQVEFIKNEFGRQDPEYFRMVGQIWTDPESFGCTSSVIETMIYMDRLKPSHLFHANVFHIMTVTEQQKLSNLPDELTIHRGHHPRLLNGVSWTIDRNVALQYAIGFPEKRNISMGIVSKTDVIAFIDR